jgi:hypothetical protein
MPASREELPTEINFMILVYGAWVFCVRFYARRLLFHIHYCPCRTYCQRRSVHAHSLVIRPDVWWWGSGLANVLYYTNKNNKTNSAGQKFHQCNLCKGCKTVC